MKNILLVNPWVYDFVMFNEWARPLGFLYLASFLRNQGFAVHWIDCLDPAYESLFIERVPQGFQRKKKKYSTYSEYKEQVEKPSIFKNIKRRYFRFGINEGIFLELLDKIPKPDLVLLTSGMTHWYPGVFEVIGVLKKRFPGVLIALGGIYASLCFEHARGKSGADRVFRRGEESAFLEWLSGILGPEKIESLIEKKGDAQPFFSSYPLHDLYGEVSFIPFLTSQGCVYSCRYCASPFLFGGFFERGPQDLFEELVFWKEKVGVEDVAFYDDALFVGKEKRMHPFLEKVIRSGIKVNFHTPNGLHIREIDEKTAVLMKESGFRTLRFGFETSDPGRQKKDANKVSNADLVRLVKILEKAGFKNDEVSMYLLMGLPGQTVSEVRQSILFVKDLGIKPKLSEYSPVPKTPLFREACSMTSLPLEKEPLYQNNSTLELWSEPFSFEVLNELKVLASQDVWR